MEPIKKLVLPIVVVAMILACGGPIQETEMVGYEKGQKRMEYLSKIYAGQDGKGYRLETHIKYSKGAADQMESIKTEYLNKDFSLNRVEKKLIRNKVVSETRIHLEGNQLVLWKKQGDMDPEEKKVSVNLPVFSNIHPLLYVKELTKPGAEKSYPVFQEQELDVRPMTVKYIGPKTIVEGGKNYTCIHFKMSTLRNPKLFDDYFVDPKTKEIIKISSGDLQFVTTR